MKSVLVLEDESSIRGFVVLNLKRSGYTVIEADSGENALIEAEKHPEIDLALLDVMLPGISGIEVAKKLRETHPGIGIIMLTAKTQETDKVSGFMAGADDYVTKPFSPGELMARVDALYRRISYGRRMEETIVRQGPFLLDRQRRILMKNDVELDLTQVEYLIADTMIKHIDTALSRAEILDAVWGKSKSDEKTVDVNMRRLRLKVEDDPSEPKYLQTIWGYGYKWNTEE